jgi:hypothetical protein
MQSLLESKPQRVDSGEEAQHGGLLDQLENCVDFTDRDDDRDLELSAGSYELERGPFSRAGESKELLEGLLSDVDGTSRPVSIVLDEEEIVSQVVFGGGIGLALEEFRELANITDIGLLRALATAVKLKILLEAKEDGRQRFFVDRHDETP